MSTGSPEQVVVTRDLRIDFIRGMVMAALVVVHVEIVSAFSYVVWERVGLVSGAEGFVILSGFLLGAVSRQRAATRGWEHANARLFDRATQLWRVNVAVITLVALLAWAGVEMREVMTFTDRFAHQTYPLYPGPGADAYRWAGRILLLRAGPHQLQILGLYVALLLLSVPALWLLERGRWRFVLIVSWLLYLAFKLEPSTPTRAQFEGGFPLLAWQLIYFHALAAGFHRDALERFAKSASGRAVVAVLALLALAFFVFAQSTPNPVLPDFGKLPLVSPERFDAIRLRWFDKNTMGVLRAVNDVALIVVVYGLLGKFWRPLHRAFGWFFVPMGQATLYVFVVHVFLVAIVAWFRPFGFDGITSWDVAINTAVHAAVLAILWLMVRYRVLFSIIPR